MVSYCQWKDSRLVVSSKPGCMTISLESSAEINIYSFDFAGRLWTSMEGRRSFRHGLDGRVLSRWKDEKGLPHRDWLSIEEVGEIDSRARYLAGAVVKGILEGNLSLQPPLSAVELNRVRKASDFKIEQQIADQEAYKRIYRPVGILPPDQYMSVVLQMTQGCSFNSCTFCTLYRDEPFKVKSPSEFLEHALAVRDFLKEGISLRKTIFLGGANALVLPQARLKPYLEIVNQVYEVKALGGIFAFLDGFSGERKTRSDYIGLADLGLDTIYVGLESGSNRLLSLLNKPSTAEQVLETVRTAKSAGIAAAVIILLGAGGINFSEEHVRETVHILNKMELDAGDMIYFSKLVSDNDSAYTHFGAASGWQPLTEDEQLHQWQAIESQLKFNEPLGIPCISVYDIRDFIF